MATIQLCSCRCRHNGSRTAEPSPLRVSPRTRRRLADLLVCVAVMKIRNVRVGVGSGPMHVRMGVTACRAVLGRVITVVIVVVMFVVVFDLVMTMAMLVCRFDRHRHADSGKRHGNQLHLSHRFAENDPGDHHADEGSRSEDDLSSGRTEITRTLHPKHDRYPITGGTDHERNRHDIDLESRRATGKGQPEQHIGGSRHRPLQQYDVFGPELINRCGDTVVDSPRKARSCDEQGSGAELSAWLPHQCHSCGSDQGRTDDDPPPEMLPEDRGGKQNRGGQLQVQQNRRGRSRCSRQAGHQERRTNGPAKDDRHQRRPPVPSQRLPSRGAADDRWKDSQPRPEVQQASQHERRDIAGELRRRRGRCAEQHSSQQASNHANPIHDAIVAPAGWKR